MTPEEMAHKEIVLRSAVKYALCVDEELPKDAAIASLKPEIGRLTDDGLWDMMKSVGDYVNRAKTEDGGWHRHLFAAEWGDVFALLSEENARRTKRREADA